MLELTEGTPSMAEVRRKYEGSDQWMKAPNGNQTNLTERQWLQVHTPEFKQWFGDWEDNPEHASKVVDGNGEPLVVDGVFLSLDSDAVLRKIQARKLQAEVLAGRIRDAERDSGARYGTMDFAYANPEVSEDIALGADDVRLLAEAIYKGNAPELVVGFRYGDIPKAMMSYNHRDQYLEAGVSIVGRVRDLDTRKSGFYEMLLGNEPYNVVVGLYAGNHGADGEMLLAPVYKLGLASDVGKLAKSATDNNGQFDNGNDSILFQLTDKETTDMVRQVDSLTKQDIGKPNAAIDISSHTPFVFRELGLDDLKVVMYRGKLARGLYLPEGRRHGHSEGLDKGIVKDVLASFADPLYAFDSKTDDNSLVAVYDVLDKHGNPVMASVTIDLNASQVLVNLVTSIYGRPLGNYQSWTNTGLLRYVDDTRKDLSKAVRLQSPSVPEKSSKDNIIYKSQLVNKPGAFFELTDEQRAGFVKKWRTDVERAVRGYEVVPTRVLEQFRGEDWADEELALREAVMDDPELWRMAEEAQDPDQLRQTLKDALVDEQEMEDNPLYDEEEVREHKRQRELLQQALASLDSSGKGATGDWVARLYWYTRTQTQEERDQKFLRTYASGKEGVLKLKAAIGKGYQTPVLSKRVRSKTGDKTYYGMQNHWPAYKGISQKVLHLPAGATDAQVQEAIDKIRENPRRYRQVLDFVESNNAYAQTVMEGMGRGDDGIMDSYQARTAAIESDEDLKKLEASGIPALAGFARRKRERIDGLANHARHGISTGKFEGINNRIQVAKRIGYGYRDDNCFFTTIRSISIPDLGSLSPKKM